MNAKPSKGINRANSTSNQGIRFFAGAAINSRLAALIHRLIAFTLILAGLIRITGVFSGNPEWSSLLFYTVLSNVLCLIWVGLLVIRTIRDVRRHGVWGVSTPSARWSGLVMMAISVTMLIYLIILVPVAFEQAGDYELFSLTDNLIHIITPCLLIVDWLLFAPKGKFRLVDPFLWTLFPYAYLVFGFTFGAFGGEFRPGQKYPYPFMNVDVLGPAGVVLWILGLSVALIIVGYIYVAIDRVLNRVFAKNA